MGKHRIYRWINLGWAMSLLGYIGLLTLISVIAYQNALPGLMNRLPGFDKAGHFFLIGLAGYFSHRALRRRTFQVGRFPIPLGPAIVLGLTLIDEGMQQFSAVRSAGYEDVVANCLGLLMFYIIDCLCRADKIEMSG